MTAADLICASPRLYHMAHEESWPSVRDRGLLSTSALLDLFEMSGAKRDAIEAAHRPESVPLTHPTHGQAVVRDQKPMSDSALERCLTDDLTPADWYRYLNQRVFFWATRDRLLTMVGAKAYRAHRQTVLTIDTEPFVERYEDRIELAVMNAGCTVPFPWPRGLDTFVPLAEFDYQASRKKRGLEKALAEVAVAHSVPDIADFVLTVEHWTDGCPSEAVFKK